MSIEVRVPQLPESVTDATLVAWNKKPGDAVSRDENLVDLETDKVVLELPAPSAGVIKELKVANGATVTSGQVLAILEASDAASAPKKEVAQPEAKPAPDESRAAAKLAPAAKRMVAEQKLDPAQIAGSGRDGRISKSDVIQHTTQQAAPWHQGLAATLGPAWPSMSGVE